MTTLSWEHPREADALNGDRRWADTEGNLTPGFDIRPGFPRLALILPDRTILEGENLP